PLPAFVGLAIPALTRMSGVYTHVTLHQLVETVDLKDAGVKSRKLYRLAGSIATHMLLSANSLSVLLPAYRKILRNAIAVDQSMSAPTASFPGVPNILISPSEVIRSIAFWPSANGVLTSAWR